MRKELSWIMLAILLFGLVIYDTAGVFAVTLYVPENNGMTAATTGAVLIEGHDAAIEKVVSSHLTVMVGDSATVNVSVVNNGGFAETFNATAYYNETAIGTEKIINLQPQTRAMLSFSWNTTGVTLGRYVLKANTSEVEADIDTSNNEYVDGTIEVGLTNVIDFPVVIGEFPFHIVVESNSTISSFQFSQPEKKMSFNASGKISTTGMCNVTVPVDLLDGNYIVLFDASPISVQKTTNTTHVFLYFAYNHASSFHTIAIIGSTVATPPIAIFTVSTAPTIAHTEITFNASDSYDPDGSIQSYQWSFDDGNITTTNTPIVTHVYSSADNYVVTLRVKDNKQLANSTQLTVTIIDFPHADFTYSPAVPLMSETLTFNASVSTPNGGFIESYEWDFGDDSTASGTIVTHMYSSVGSYTVVLNVTDTEGLWDTITKTVTISLHNIAITGLTATPSSVKVGQRVSIVISVVNAGNFTESFDITGYYNSTVIKKMSIVDLAPSTTNVTTVVWNTVGVAAGTYVLKANASIVTAESVTTDNSLVGDTVTLQKLDTQLTLSASVTTLTLGENTTLRGTFTPARSSFHIKVLYRRVGETAWSIAGGTPTNTKSQYSFDWTPPVAGNYEVKANWQGDATTSPSDSNMQQISVKEPSASINFNYVIIPLAIVVIIAVALYYLKSRK